MKKSHRILVAGMVCLLGAMVAAGCKQRSASAPPTPPATPSPVPPTTLVAQMDSFAAELTGDPRNDGPRILQAAEETAAQVSDPSERAQVLLQMAPVRSSQGEGAAPTDLEEAGKVARRIRDRASKAQAFMSLAQAWLPQDREKAKENLETAYNAARNIPDQGSRVERLALIAGSFAAVDPGRAQEIGEEARQAAGQIEGKTFQVRELANLVVERARWDPAGAVRDLEGIDHPQIRLEALSRILDEAEGLDWAALLKMVQAAKPGAEKATCLVKLQGKAPFKEESERKASEEAAHEAVNQMGNPAGKVDCLVALARTLGEQERERKLALLSEAEAVAKTMKEMDRSKALGTVVTALLAIDLQAAASLAGKVHAPEFQMEALNTVALALRDTDPDQARKLLEKSHKAARRLKEQPQWQAKLLGELAGALDAVDPEQALPVRREAVEAAIMIWNDADRAGAFCSIAAAMRQPAG